MIVSGEKTGKTSKHFAGYEVICKNGIFIISEQLVLYVGFVEIKSQIMLTISVLLLLWIHVGR